MNEAYYTDLFGFSDGEGEAAQFDKAIESTLISAAGASLQPPPMLSPLPPDTPCHPGMSQYEHGDHGTGTAPRSTIPLSLASRCEEYSWEEEESDFSRWPKDDAVVTHSFEATENLRGLQTIVALKTSRSSFLEESGIFPEYNPTVTKLEACRPTAQNGTYAFLQVTTRGHGFRKHDNTTANSTLTMTSQSYLALLRFFEKEWARVASKMKSELQSMQQSNCGVNICKGLSFYGSGVSRYKRLLESFGDFALFVIVSVDSTVTSTGEKIFVQVKYKKHPNSPMADDEIKGLGEIELPVEALLFLAGSRENLFYAVNNLGRDDNFLNRKHHNKENVFGSNRSNGSSLLPPLVGNASFTELASQIRHPVPEVELKMQTAAAKILEYASGGSTNTNQMSADEIRRRNAEVNRLAPPFCNKKTTSANQQKLSANKGEPKKAVLSTQGNLDNLLNRGLSSVTQDRGYFTAEGSANQQAEKVKRVSTAPPRKRAPAKDENGDFKAPKNKKPRV